MIFTQVFSRFFEFQVHPFHTLEGSGSLLHDILKFCGIPGAPLSHFEGVRVVFTQYLDVFGVESAPLSHFEGVGVTFT